MNHDDRIFFTWVSATFFFWWLGWYFQPIESDQTYNTIVFFGAPALGGLITSFRS